MVRWCIRLTRLTLVCEVIRYRLVQVRQNQKKTFRVGGPQSPFSISSSFILSFVLLPFFLNTKMKMASRCSCPRARTSWSRERGQPACGAHKKMAHDQLARLRPGTHALTVSFTRCRLDKFFLWWSLCQSTGKKLDLLGQWTLKKLLAGATSEPIPSCPSCACDWEHLNVAVLPGSCPAMGWYMHFSCSHLCHSLSPSLSR